MTNEVFYSGNFWTHSSWERAGLEQKINCAFEWAGRHWLVPSVYLCGKGLVVDVCMRVDPAEITQFLQKWGLNGDEEYSQFTPEQENQIQVENPLEMDLMCAVTVNGQTSEMAQSSGVTYMPEGMVDGWARDDEMDAVLTQYDLDLSYAWQITRISFPWKRVRRPKEIKTLEILMRQREVPIYGETFCVHEPGEKVKLTHPTRGEIYILTVESLEQQELPMDCREYRQWKFPNHLQTMEYTISPEPAGRIQLADCETGDEPIKQEPFQHREHEKEASAVSVIGGADGPTAIFVGVSCKHKADTAEDAEAEKKAEIEKNAEAKKIQIAGSSLHFEPRETVKWRAIFYEKQIADKKITLVSP